MLRREGIARERIDEDQVVKELVGRLREQLAGEPLDLLINDTCFREEKRLRRSSDPTEQAYLASLRAARKRLAKAGPEELQDVLDGIVAGYAREIHGHFDERIYSTATRVLPRGLALVLRRQKPLQTLREGLGNLNLSDQIVASGAVATFDRLVERGTVVLVPTHLSNLDSPVIGNALHDAGLPPMTYGAGINLFTNWMLSYFMDHLGAYRVDRAKGHRLYKETLKGYSQLAMERRWHSLFFPGGTRSRSGKVEAKLKLGLMGTALAGFQNNLRLGRPRPRMFFIPATINYHLVLEAETLIDDHLQEAGQSRYIITDDEFSKPERVLSFTRHMLAMDNAIEVVFGQPLDPFGNPVDDNGDSLDPQGRPFDPAGYVMRDGEVARDQQRDRAYTRRLGAAIADSFQRNTKLFDTHVLATALQRLLQRRHPGLDVYRLLLLPLDERRFSLDEVDAEVGALQGRLRELHAQGALRLGADVAQATPAVLREAALRKLGRYHSSRALRRHGHHVAMEDPRLTLYYANRLAGYDLEGSRS